MALQRETEQQILLLLRSIAQNTLTGGSSGGGIATNLTVQDIRTLNDQESLTINAGTIGYASIAVVQNTEVTVAIQGVGNIVLSGEDVNTWDMDFSRYANSVNPATITINVVGSKCLIELGKVS